MPPQQASSIFFPWPLVLEQLHVHRTWAGSRAGIILYNPNLQLSLPEHTFTVTAYGDTPPLSPCLALGLTLRMYFKCVTTTIITIVSFSKKNLPKHSVQWNEFHLRHSEKETGILMTDCVCCPCKITHKPIHLLSIHFHIVSPVRCAFSAEDGSWVLICQTSPLYHATYPEPRSNASFDLFLFELLKQDLTVDLRQACISFMVVCLRILSSGIQTCAIIPSSKYWCKMQYLKKHNESVD